MPAEIGDGLSSTQKSLNCDVLRQYSDVERKVDTVDTVEVA